MGEAQSNIVELPRTGYAVTNVDLAALMRGLADRVEAGEWGDCRTVIFVIEDGDGKVSRKTFGGPNDLARVMGLLHYALISVVVE